MSDNLLLRALRADDFHKGYLQLLSQLTVIGEVSESQFNERFQETSSSTDYKIMVIEDQASSKVIGTATCLVERKFIRGCGKAAHIEDVVVDSSYRGQKLGNRLIQALIEAAKEMGCYKVILDCSESNASFYEKCGLVRKEIQMVKYL